MLSSKDCANLCLLVDGDCLRLEVEDDGTGLTDDFAEDISPKTVERHRANILDKLGMRDRVEVTRYAIRAGLIEP